jgi:hypothetical protein
MSRIKSGGIDKDIKAFKQSLRKNILAVLEV